jgi:WS/DGAT/MGAT family acyltransferase
MSRVSLTDYAFLLTETEDSPRHVAGIQIYEPPADYSGDFVADLHAGLLTRPVHAPFDRRLRISATGGPQWIRDPNFDVEYHVRRSALPAPGSREQLADLTSRLHSFLLDRDRPLWEFHIIEGLEGGRFALYTKIHHAYCDGATLTRMLSGTLSQDPDNRELRAYWEAPDAESPRESPRGLLSALAETAGGVRKGIGTGIELSRLFTRMGMEKLGLAHGGLDVPFTAPRTLLNGELTRARRVAGTRIELDRIKAVAKATETTVNDVVVTVADTALRHYMESRGQKIEKPLVAQLPVNLRRESDTRVTNVVAILPVRLAGASPNPVRRLRQVSRSTSELKGSLAGLSQGAVITYTLLIQGAAQLGELLGLNNYIPPLGNILISNLPGPRQPLYLRGARMLEIYPISTIPPGMTMNITVFSYDGQMFFGMIAGYDAIPGLDGLPGMLADAMSDLEAAVTRIGKPQRGKPVAPPRAAEAARRAASSVKRKRAGKSAGGPEAGLSPAQKAARAAARKKRRSAGAATAEKTGRPAAEQETTPSAAPGETTVGKARSAAKRKTGKSTADTGKSAAKAATSGQPKTRKAPAKKARAKKAPAKKTSVKKSSAKTRPAKKASSKRTAGKKPSARKRASKKTVAKKVPAAKRKTGKARSKKAALRA